MAEGPMTREDVQSVLKSLTQSAQAFVDEDLSPDRAKATQYYKGAPLGNEEEGRSQVVMTTVRDTILSVIPALLRTFFGTERAVEFTTDDPAKVEQAEQESAYVLHLFETSPNALLDVLASVKDGLTKRLGFVKWWVETKVDTSTIRQMGLVQEQLAMYENDPEVTYTVEREYAAPDGTKLYDCSVTRSVERKIPRWGAVPPEEVLWDRDARAFNGGAPKIVVHRRSPTVGDLVNEGFEYNDVVEYAKQDDTLRLNAENVERNPSGAVLPGDDASTDKTSWTVPFYEAYVMIDEDGDHRPELRRYYMAGEGHELVTPKGHDSKFVGEVVREVPMAAWCPDPEPHTVEGQSYADLTMDLQRVDTALVRGNLDSLGLALHGRVAYQEGVVNPHDILNTEIGAAIRTTGRPQDALYEFGHTYVGKESFPLIEHFRRVREERTGFNMESQGLNADALQSSTKEGVTATLTAAQARTELVARLYLEQIMVPLMRGLRGLAKEHQNYSITKQIRGKFITTDPSLWDDQCDVRVKIMLGGGLAEQKMQTLMGIVAKQEFIIGQLGPANPIVNFAQYTRAILKLVETSGHPDAELYFTRITDEQAAELRQKAAAQPPPKDPATMLAEAQIELKKGDQEIAKNKLMLEMQKFEFEQMLQMEKLRQDFALREKELELKYTAKLDEMQMQQFIKGQEASLKDAQATQDSLRKSALTMHETELKAEGDIHKAELGAAAKVEAARITAAAKPKKEGA